jgi:hypothetical protein
LFGQGANGAGGVVADFQKDNGGAGSIDQPGAGFVSYGSGAPGVERDSNFLGRRGFAGAARIIYPGQTRRFPSTNAGET